MLHEAMLDESLNQFKYDSTHFQQSLNIFLRFQQCWTTCSNALDIRFNNCVERVLKQMLKQFKRPFKLVHGIQHTTWCNIFTKTFATMKGVSNKIRDRCRDINFIYCVRIYQIACQSTTLKFYPIINTWAAILKLVSGQALRVNPKILDKW